MSEGYKILDWDATITEDEPYTLLPEGDYDFKVVDFQRGTSKRNAVPMAVLTLEVGDGKAKALVKDYIVLRDDLEWKIGAFFRSVGMKKHGEAMRMDFQGSVGRTGRCRVKVDEYIGQSGNSLQNNKIDRYYFPENYYSQAEERPKAAQSAPPWMRK